MTSEGGNEERKKVALDALERRFALAQDQLLQQQQPPKRKRPLPQPKPQLSTYNFNNFNNTNTNSSLHQNPISTLPSPNHCVKKDTETNDPVYSLLSHPVHENLVSTSIEISDRKGSVPDKILHELLRNGDAAQKYNQGSKSKKSDNWILLDNVDKGSGTYDRARIKALNKNSKRSKKHMSMKQHKKFGSLTLPDDSRNFEIYKPMHEMWKGYITQLLKNVGNNQFAQRLLSADLHGAIILVVQSKIVSLIGVIGIMIRQKPPINPKFVCCKKMAAISRKQGYAMASNLVKTLIRSPNLPNSSPLSSLHKVRFVSGVFNSEITTSHTAKWMQATDKKSPMELINEVAPIKVDGRIALCAGDIDPALGHPIEFICLDKDEPAVCKYCGLRYFQDHHH